MSATVETTAYLILSEAITNVAGHARASHLDVDVRADRGWLVFTVADDGVGPDGASRNPDAAPGVGIGSMSERAGELGGRCIVMPLPGGGTLVSGRLPLGEGAAR